MVSHTSTPVDYLVIGHICYDLTPDGKALGGSAAYAGRTAQALGGRTAVLTSWGAREPWQVDLPDVAVERVPAEATTTFENVYTPHGREQTLHARADVLRRQHVPVAWREAAVVHLAPIADEVDPEVVYAFGDSLIGLTPQGWMRRWDENGRVYAGAWAEAAAVLPLATAVILSEEDLLHEALLVQYRQWARLLVLTRGAGGCTVFAGEEVRHFGAPRVDAVELTGAGDIFAAAFLLHLYQQDDPWRAAQFANEVAATAVTAATLPAKIEKIRRYRVTDE